MPTEDGLDYVVCMACGTINDQATAYVEELLDDLSNQQTQQRKHLRRIATLEGERGRALEADPHYIEACRVLDAWHDLCAPRAREPHSEPRVKAVIARLRGRYTVGELIDCVKGYARFPYLVRHRRTAFGQQTDRMVEAEWIFGKPQNVDRGLAMLDTDMARQPLPAIIVKVPWHRIWRANHRLVHAALNRRWGTKGLVGEGKTDFPCPFCAGEAGVDAPWSLEVFDEVGHSLASCWRCGITEDRILGAILDVEGLLG